MVLIYDLCQELVTQNSNYCEPLLDLEKVEDINFPYLAGLTYKNEKSFLTINPELLSKFSRQDQLSLLQHELFHFINLHHARRAGRDLTTWNLACDCAVNSLLKVSDVLRELLIFPQMFNLPEGKSAEWYYEALLKNNVEFKIENHQSWTGTDFSIKNKKWSQILKQYLRYCLIGKKISSNKRISRRLGRKPGKKRLKAAPSLLIALDVSPSAAESLTQFWNQVKVASSEINIPVTVIEFSDKINSIKDLAQVSLIETRASEETRFNPVLKEAQNFSCCVIFTDGLNSDLQLLKCSKPIIWVYPAGATQVKYQGKHIWLD